MAVPAAGVPQPAPGGWRHAYRRRIPALPHRLAAERGRAQLRPQPLAYPRLLMARSRLVKSGNGWQPGRRQLDPSRPADSAGEPPVPRASGCRNLNRQQSPISMIWGCSLDASQERLHSMRTCLVMAALLFSVFAPGQTVQQKAAEKTLARKAQADCDAQTARVGRTFTAVVKETRVYSVFYSPRYSKCLAAVYLPINKELIAASVINLDTAGGTQHIVWENLFSKPFDAISELDRQIDKLSK